MISKEKDFQEFFPVWNKLTAGQQEQLEHAVRYEHAKRNHHSNGSLDCVGVLLIHSGQLRAYMISEEGRKSHTFRLFERDLCLFSASCMMPNIQFDTIIEAEKDTDFWLIRLMSINPSWKRPLLWPIIQMKFSAAVFLMSCG